MFEKLEMTWVASRTIPVWAPLKIGTGVARPLEEHRCQEAGTEDLSLGALVSSKQKYKGEGTMVRVRTTISPVENRTGSQALVKVE